MSGNKEMLTLIAAASYIGWVSEHGFPNGLPSWMELPEKPTEKIAADPLSKQMWEGIAEHVLGAIEIKARACVEYVNEAPNLRGFSSDIGMLIAMIESLEEATGEGPEEEDRIIFDQIKQRHESLAGAE